MDSRFQVQLEEDCGDSTRQSWIERDKWSVAATRDNTLKVGFYTTRVHGPSSQVELTAHGRPVCTTRVDGPS